MPKKAVAWGAAVLVILIALFMVLYILMVSPEERERLLSPNETAEQPSAEPAEEVTAEENMSLLMESPGKLYVAKTDKVKHEVPSINLYVKTQPSLKQLAESLTIERGFISSSPKELSFPIDELANLEKVSLVFNAVQSSGRLEIWLNDHLVYDSEASGVEIVTLPNTYLKEKNKITFEVNHPGLAFWKKNKYVLKDISLKLEYKLLNPEEKRTFVLSTDDYENLKTGKLEFNFYCNNLEDTTTIKVLLNKKEIFSEVVGCIAGSRSIELSKEDFEKGKNELIFSIGGGDFQFNNIFVETSLKETTYPTYHFSVDSSVMEKINQGKKVYLYLALPETGRKSATININGYQFSLNTENNEYEVSVTDYIKLGDNFIKIVPGNSFAVDLLRIYI